MKKSLLALCCCASFISFGQTGWFLQPMVGVGMGSAKFNSRFVPSSDLLLVINADAQFNIGYQHNKFQFSTGLEYLLSGYGAKYIYTDINGNPVGNGQLIAFFNHYVVPATVGYKINKSNSFSLQLLGGVDMTYNFPATSIITDMTGHKQSDKMDPTFFRHNYQRISLWGHAGMEADIRINSSLKFVVAPVFSYMATKFDKGSLAKQHNYNLLINAGLKWNLGTDKAKVHRIKE
jgi:hypothetical protein